jgi:hypothetical protein
MKPRRSRKDNPWELLFVALLFLLLALPLITTGSPVAFRQPRARYFPASVTVFSCVEAHTFGWCAVCVAGLLVGAYFYVRRSIIVEKSRRARFLEE